MSGKACKTCKGFGFWAVGRYAPIGRIDAEEGMPTLPCPECGANRNETDLQKELRKKKVSP